MIIDSSAVVAMLRNEPEAAAFLAAFDNARVRRISAASVLELEIVTGDGALIDDFLRDMGILVLPIDARQLALAREGHRRFGRRSGSPAKLNFGDCFSYAAARATGEPLLFKGDDFIHTDVEAAL